MPLRKCRMVAMKKILLVKILGSIALATSLLGIFVAVGGNLNLFNQNRTPIKPLASEKKNNSDNSNQPKYSFYDELKQRKTELEQTQQATEEGGQASKQVSSDNNEDSRLYLIQVGAFRDKSDAETVENKLKKLGYKTQIRKPNSMFLVQTGPYKGKNLAKSTEQKLTKQKFPTLIKLYNQ